jgi:hypothetical protein
VASRWLIGCWLFLPVAASAQARDSGAFVVMLGNDTVALESYVRTARQLIVRAVTRVPETRVIDLRVDWDEAGRLTAYDMLNTPPQGSGGPAPIRTIATVMGDSVQIAVSQGNALPRVRKIRGGADLPLISYLYSPQETAILRARQSRAESLTLLSGNGPVSYRLRWAPDSALLTQSDNNVIRVALDAAGRITSWSGAETTFKSEVRTTEIPDIDAVASRWPPLGNLSPRDTARFVANGMTVLVDYGRPAARGREIFGRLVPWDRVWRTGANAATQLETATALEINGVTIPAGEYSLWTIPSRTRPWQLVINKQTGQWGTAYDESYDLARIPIRTQSVNDLVERFTVTIERQGNGGVMKMVWSNTQMTVPFTIK